MDSTIRKMERMVREGGEGRVWFPSDFFECGNEKAVSKALQRLVEEEVLMRMTRGLYCSPSIDRMWGMGKLPAGADDVIKAIAEREGFKLGPAPGEALNSLGLSDDVVMNPVYTTDGPSRSIHYRDNRRPIYLYHIPPKFFNFKSHIMMLAAIALNDIGKEHLWEVEFDRMEEIFSRVPYAEIKDDLRITPTWMRNIILGFYGKQTGNS